MLWYCLIVVMCLFSLGPPEYVAGPVNGHLYAQVDKAFKKRVRSMSLDSGARSRGGEHLNFFENRANTLNRRNAYGFKSKNADCGINQPSLQYNGTMQHSEVKSIDKLLQELGECSELLDSTMQQARPSTRGMESSTTRLVNGGSRSPTPPGPPVRQKASFDAGERYNRKGGPGEPLHANGIRGSGTRSPTTLPPYLQNSSWNGNPRTGQMSNGFSVGETPSFVLHEAALSQTSPPVSPLSPKFYATQMMPRTFKATTVTHTTVGYNSDPNRLDDVGTNGMFSVTDGWTTADSGKQREGPLTFDFNNNKPSNDIDLFDLDGRKTTIEDSETLPEKGNVRSKIALLTDMFQPDKMRPLPHHQNIKGQLIPMPGLTSASPTEVFKEISNYNAKSLAPGELSHMSGTLYISGAPPKRIIEQSKHVTEPPRDTDIMGLKESRIAPAHEYLVHDHKTGTSHVFHCHAIQYLCDAISSVTFLCIPISRIVICHVRIVQHIIQFQRVTQHNLSRSCLIHGTLIIDVCNIHHSCLRIKEIGVTQFRLSRLCHAIHDTSIISV